MARLPHAGRALALLLLVGVLASACGASGSAALSPVGRDADAGASPGAPAASGVPGAPQDGGGVPDGQPAAPVDEAKIVRTGSLGLEVQDVPTAVGAAQRAIDDLGGYVGASRQARTDDRPVASITYRIPTSRWDEALAAIRALGVAINEQTDALEVTGQLVDLAARIENLRASERALQGIAASTTSVPDLLEVQDRLFDVRGEIEQLSAQQLHLQDQASYGTLTVTFGVEVEAIEEAAKNWDPGNEVNNATASLVEILQLAATAGIWFGIVWLPVLGAIVVVALAILAVVRRLGWLRRHEPDLPATPTPAG